MPSHSHSFTPSGTVGSHSHSFTPSGTVGSHTHSFTPSGTVSSHTHTGPSHTHSFSGTTGEMSGDTTGWWNMTGNKNGRGSGGRVSNYEYEDSNGCSWYDHNPVRYTIDLSHTHSFSGTTGAAGTGNTGATTPSFTGTAGNTGATTPSFTGTAGNTGATTPSFTGTAGNTSSSGSGSSFSILPPYVVKYCWERTA